MRYDRLSMCRTAASDIRRGIWLHDLSGYMVSDQAANTAVIARSRGASPILGRTCPTRK